MNRDDDGGPFQSFRVVNIEIKKQHHAINKRGASFGA